MRYPPAFIPGDRWGRWPLVSEHSWCGEHKAKAKPAEKPKAKKSDDKLSYGEFGSVKLTPYEYDKLFAKTGQNNAVLWQYIHRLDRYSQSHPTAFAKYKRHYAVLLQWYDRDHPKTEPEKKKRIQV